ncbi:hypothetical protein VP1G_04769 [Cytospora mali]|uniref:SHSP domain-containing protein n=1 Tax=Cytospora mali TaxID=578113 RepID=A0A194V0K6_CYTMA|nr:hypothetical protein VP1G_04769 [Valsa mali var. pyri (nom. inval.)]
MAEEIIQPQVAPPNAPKYYYPGWYYYAPEPYQTTHIPKHHHHLPPQLKHAVQAIGELAHPFGRPYALATPHCDIRESKSAYYIDVELPGLREKKDVKLKWTGSRSLFIYATINRQPLPEETVETSSESEDPAESSRKKDEEHHKEKPIHFVKQERKTGELARAFTFPVDVKQDETTAKLAYGVLTITVPKKNRDLDEHKNIDIEHAGH